MANVKEKTDAAVKVKAKHASAKFVGESQFCSTKKGILASCVLSVISDILDHIVLELDSTSELPRSV